MPLWFAASFLLVSCYRLTGDLLRVGPRSLTRQGFVLPVTGLRQTLTRHLPGFSFIWPPPRVSPSLGSASPGSASDTPAPRLRRWLLLLVVLNCSWAVDIACMAVSRKF